MKRTIFSVLLDLVALTAGINCTFAAFTVHDSFKSPMPVGMTVLLMRHFTRDCE